MNLERVDVPIFNQQTYMYIDTYTQREARTT